MVPGGLQRTRHARQRPAAAPQERGGGKEGEGRGEREGVEEGKERERERRREKRRREVA